MTEADNKQLDKLATNIFINLKDITTIIEKYENLKLNRALADIFFHLAKFCEEMAIITGEIEKCQNTTSH